MPKFNQEEIATTLPPQSLARRHKRQARCAGKFIKGPIPLTWWTNAAALPGKALALASAIWFKAGLINATTDIVVGEPSSNSENRKTETRKMSRRQDNPRTRLEIGDMSYLFSQSASVCGTET